MFYFISGISFTFIQFALSAQVVMYLNSPDLAFPIVLSSFAVSNLLFFLLNQKIVFQLDRLKISLLSLFVIFLSIFSRPILEYFSAYQGFLSIEIVAFVLFVLIGLLGALAFPVVSSQLRHQDQFNTIWMLNGLGILLASVAVNSISLILGLQFLLILGIGLYWISLMALNLGNKLTMRV
jgi:hypothetical protein